MAPWPEDQETAPTTKLETHKPVLEKPEEGEYSGFGPVARRPRTSPDIKMHAVVEGNRISARPRPRGDHNNDI